MTVKTEERCDKCGHYMGIHFQDVDELGYWGFCGITDCTCFWSERKEDSDSPSSGNI